MSKLKQKEQPRIPLAEFFNRRIAVVIFLVIACLAGLPLKIQNIGLNGYISDDAWWHYRQIKHVVETGKRLNPDIYEFVSLSRPQTYPPLFHYTVAYIYKLFRPFSRLVSFTHYYNILEGILYILLIYAIAYLLTQDKIFSIIGALSASVSYGMIIRARAGELMPFVLGDLLALAGVCLLLLVIRRPKDDSVNSYSILSGIFFGLSMLSWAGAVLIYVPLVFLAFAALIIAKPGRYKKTLKLFFLCALAFMAIVLPWYLPIINKYGLNPHSPEMSWFMQNFTVLRQVKPFNFYIFTTGISIFFLPIAFLACLFKRKPAALFLLSWIILAAISTYSGWRGYVAVVPVVSAIAMSFVLSKALRPILRKAQPIFRRYLWFYF